MTTDARQWTAKAENTYWVANLKAPDKAKNFASAIWSGVSVYVEDSDVRSAEQAIAKAKQILATSWWGNAFAEKRFVDQKKQPGEFLYRCEYLPDTKYDSRDQVVLYSFVYKRKDSAANMTSRPTKSMDLLLERSAEGLNKALREGKAMEKPIDEAIPAGRI